MLQSAIAHIVLSVRVTKLIFAPGLVHPHSGPCRTPRWAPTGRRPPVIVERVDKPRDRVDRPSAAEQFDGTVEAASRSPAFVPRGPWLVAAATTVTLLLLAGRYGYHHDE